MRIFGRALGAVLAAGIMAIVFVASGGPGVASVKQQPPVVNVTVGIPSSNIDFGPFWVAQAKGYFVQHRLNISTINVAPGATTFAALASGGVDTNLYSLGDTLTGITNGVPIRALSGLGCFGNGALMVRAGANVSSVADLKGMTIGTTSLGSGSYYQTRYILVKAGLNPDRDVTFVSLGSSPASFLAAFQNKQVDAAMAFEPVRSQLLADGLARVIVDFRMRSGPLAPPIALRPGNACHVVIGTNNFIKRNAGAARRFVAALAKAAAFLNDPKNRTQAAKIIVKATGADPSLTSKVVVDKKGFWTTTLPARVLAITKEFALTSGAVSQPITLTYAQVIAPGITPTGVRFLKVGAVHNTLRKIAEWKYGLADDWRLIYNLNRAYFAKHKISLAKAPNYPLPRGTKIFF